MDNEISRLKYDFESYPNFLCLTIGDKDGNRITVHNDDESAFVDLLRSLEAYKKDYIFEAWNGVGYDAILLDYLLLNYNTYDMDTLTKNVYNLTKVIIEEQTPHWVVRKQWGIPEQTYQFDLSQYFTNRSVKAMGIRTGYKELEELPYEPGTVLNDKQKQDVLNYNIKDVDVLDYVSNFEENQARFDGKYILVTNEELGLCDLSYLSFTDRQLTERILLGDKYDSTKPIKEDGSYYYKPPFDFDFQTPNFQKMYKDVQDIPLDLKPKSKFTKDVEDKDKDKVLAEGLFKDIKIFIKTGGMHWSDDGIHEEVFDADWDSYYPFLMLAFNFMPQVLRENVNKFRWIIERRIQAKKNKEPIANALKIVINSIYGALGMGSSKLLSIRDKYNVTITGQLLIMKYAELLHLNGYNVIYMNTDGLSYTKPLELKDSNKDEEIRQYMMEISKNNISTDYFDKLISKDVNNFFILQNGKVVKAKGAYNLKPFQKNYSHKRVSFEAVINYMTTGQDIKEYILNCTDPTAFLLNENFNKTYHIHMYNRFTGEKIPQTTKNYRWYVSIDKSWRLNAFNSNTGSWINRDGTHEGVVLLDNLSDELPKDLDYDYYITEASDLLFQLNGESIRDPKTQGWLDILHKHLNILEQR